MKSSITVFLLFVCLHLIFNCNYLLANKIKIIEQPKSITECQGKAVTLSVDAQSDENLKLEYQWYKDSKIISGETASLLKFESLRYDHSGTYFCRIKSVNGNEIIDSQPAALYVVTPTSITKQPNDIKLSKNFEDSVIVLTFDAHINGVSIQEAKSTNEYVIINWFKFEDNKNLLLNDDDTYFGTKSNNLSIKLENLKDTSYFFAVIEGKCGIDTTRIVSVIKNSKDLLISVQIEDLEACEGNLYSLKAKTKTNYSNTKIDYRWFKDSKPLYNKPNLKGIFTDELIFNPILKDDVGKYRLEVQIKDSNIVSLSNRIEVKVERKPEIVCIRIDTMSQIILNWPTVSVFYRDNTDSVYLEIYKDEKNIKTYRPFSINPNFVNTGYEWVHDGIYNLIIPIEKKDINSKYWAIASNKCGISYSDTVSIKNDKNNFSKCDPWHQKQDYCVSDNDSAFVQLDLRQFPYHKFIRCWKWWFHTDLDFLWDYSNGDSSKQILKPLIKKGQDQFDLEFCDPIDNASIFSPAFNLTIRDRPKIATQPKNKTVTLGNNEIIFMMGVENDPLDQILGTLYYIPYLGASPFKIMSNILNTFDDFKYEKDITISDEGYYYAEFASMYCGTTISDTVKVTVVPSGIVANIVESSTDKYFMISPNPARDYIEISSINHMVNLRVDKGLDIQIFDMLGVAVSNSKGNPTPTLPEGEGERIDVSFLAQGVYFLKIGNKVEKFVKI